jgi:hypothetical protein
VASEREAARLAVDIASDKARRAGGEVRAARKRWAKARRAVAAGYRRARPKARARWKAWKARERERIKTQVLEWRQGLRARWQARRERIAALGAQGVARARLRAEHERLRVKELALHRRQVEHQWRAHKHSERAGESDDIVRTDLAAHHPELLPVFERLRRTFKARPRMSRTETILHWAEENPREVMVISSHEAERGLKHAIREHEKAEREAHRERARVVKTTTRQRRRAAVADVPF